MTYFYRGIEKEVLKGAKSYPVVTLLGPRQSGKTTLVRHIFSDKPYVSLENPDNRQFAELDPRSFFEKYKDGAVIDEVQRVPSLLSYIQGIVDERKQKGQFILTGSHQLELTASISQSLAGRTAIFKLWPLSLSELTKDFRGLELDDYLYQGMYPRIYEDELNPTDFYSYYLQTYVERDVRQMINVRDLRSFTQFVKLCASRVGQLINFSQMGNEIGVSSHTIESWLSILEASFIIFRLSPYYENFGKRLIKSPKIYFTDVGLAAYCLDIREKSQLERDPLRGNFVENFIISEIIKTQINRGIHPSIYFYRDSNQQEVDLLIKTANQFISIEIKSSKTFHASFLKGLNNFSALAGERVKQSFLIYAGDYEQKIQNTSVINFKSIDKNRN